MQSMSFSGHIRERPSSLAWAGGASVVIHAAILALLARTSVAPGRADASDLAPEPEPPALEELLLPEPEPEQEPEVKLGIERSTLASIDWIGFEDPTPHEAPESDITQPALAREEAAGGPVSPPPEQLLVIAEPSADEQAEPAPEIELEPDPVPEPVDLAIATAPPALEAPPAMPEGAGPAIPEPSPETDLVEGPPSPSAQPVIDPVVLAPPVEPAPSPEPQEPSVPPEEGASVEQPDLSVTNTPEGAAPDAPPVPAAGAPGAPTDALPGLPSDKESEGFSRTKPLVIQPGRPAAPKGLDVQTLRPRWAHYTVLTASPRAPLVEVHFQRDGSVHRARVLETSGYPDVDQPVLDAVYRWRASGEALRKLPPDPLPPAEPATVRLFFRILLRG